MLKKKWPWMILFVFIAALTVWAVVFQSDSFSFRALVYDLQNARMAWIVAALLAMVGYILFEGLALRTLVRGLTEKKRGIHWNLYAASDLYFSAITPSATGGQPASAFFMIRDGIPAAQTTVILLLNLILYTMALLVIGLGAVVLRPKFLGRVEIISRVLVFVGMGILLGLMLLFFLLLKKEAIIAGVAHRCISLGERLHLIRRGAEKHARLDEMIEEYSICSSLIRTKKRVVAKAFLYNFLQQFCKAIVAMFVYLALTRRPDYAIDVLCAQALTNVGANCIPIPGAMGVADYIMIQCLEGIPGIFMEANLELISRSIIFYACVVISMLMTAWGYFVAGKNGRQSAKEKE